MHPVEDAFAFAVAPDLSSAYVVTGDGGTMVEVVTLADGTRRLFAELPDGVGGRVLGVDHATGRLAVIATSNPAATNRGDPAAPDDHLIVYDDQGSVLTNVALSRQGLVDRVGWLDSERLIVVYSLPTTHVELIGLDGTVHSSFQPDAEVTSGALSGDRLYLGTPDGIVSTALDGNDPRTFPLSIARVRDVVAIDSGPNAAPQLTPTVPAPTTARHHRLARRRPPRRQPAWRPPRTDPTPRHRRPPAATTHPAAPRVATRRPPSLAQQQSSLH